MEPAFQRERRPHLLLVPAGISGHYAPVLQLLYHLNEVHNNNAAKLMVTLISNEKRVLELSELHSRGDFQRLDLRLLVVFTSPLPAHNDPRFPSRPWTSCRILMKDYNSYMDNWIRELDPAEAPTCMIADMFFDWTQSTAEKLGIPWHVLFSTASWYLFTSITGSELLSSELKDEPMPKLTFGRIRHLPPEMCENPEFFATLTKALIKASAILVNTAEELDAQTGGLIAIRALLEDLAIAGNCPAPRVLPVGPLAHIPGFSRIPFTESSAECLRWLDSQRESSVLYIAFGSIANISPAAMLELAHGLETSGVPFLWVLKAPVSSKQSPSADVRSLLPPGFQERTTGQGFIETGWAPQQQILAHRSTGAFMSHCGWNSTLEAICAGVPIITWPIFADQPLNARFLVEVEKVGLSMTSAGEEDNLDDVQREDVASVIELMMIAPKRQEIKKNSLRMKQILANTIVKGGTSQRVLQSFLEEVIST